MSMSDTITQTLTALLKRLDITLNEEALEKLAAHHHEVEHWGKTLGLTKAGGRELLIKHTIDSLLALPFLKEIAPATAIDIGSGAGFPGIPLAIAMPETSFILAERRQKRASFLAGTKALLHLDNVAVFADDFNLIKKPADMVVFRALTPLTPAFVKTLLQRCRHIMAYKGRLDEAEEEAAQLRRLNFTAALIPLQTLHADEERTLLHIRK
jgi:16S rRNA (guanine527-N7)-methyltransferase